MDLRNNGARLFQGHNVCLKILDPLADVLKLFFLKRKANKLACRTHRERLSIFIKIQKAILLRILFQFSASSIISQNKENINSKKSLINKVKIVIPAKAGMTERKTYNLQTNHTRQRIPFAKAHYANALSISSKSWDFFK